MVHSVLEDKVWTRYHMETGLITQGRADVVGGGGATATDDDGGGGGGALESRSDGPDKHRGHRGHGQ